jgi:hypothetical protein
VIVQAADGAAETMPTLLLAPNPMARTLEETVEAAAWIGPLTRGRTAAPVTVVLNVYTRVAPLSTRVGELAVPTNTYWPPAVRAQNSMRVNGTNDRSRQRSGSSRSC